MTAPTLAQIRSGLQARLQTITTFDPSQVHARRVPTIVPPAAIIEPAEGEFFEYDTSTDSRDLHLTVLVLVCKADDPTGYDELDAYINPTGAQSISAAIDADDSLGGVVDEANVVGASGYGDYTIGGLDYFGCQFAVTVYLRS